MQVCHEYVYNHMHRKPERKYTTKIVFLVSRIFLLLVLLFPLKIEEKIIPAGLHKCCAVKVLLQFLSYLVAREEERHKPRKLSAS